MSYIEQNLMPGEKIIYRARLHWIVFLWPVIFLLFALVSLFFALVGLANGSGAIQGPLLGGLFVVLAAVAAVPQYITYITSEFGVTNKRVLVKVGFIRRDTMETLLSKVEGISVSQGILGRILGYGTIIVTGTGGSGAPFHKIATPLEFRRQVHERIAANQEAASGF